MQMRQQMGPMECRDAAQPLRLVLLVEEWNALTEQEQEALLRRVPPGKRLLIVTD